MANDDLAQLVQAFGSLAANGFVMGAEWQAVHEICQAHEGEPLFDWGHALCHRIEGDDRNADYWYRRAGKRRAAGTVAEEWSAMKAELSALI
ncbi:MULTISPECIES: hypothetical protein [Rhizobium/Agrobacterium group]|uniref:Primase C-terminal 2 domain-containing protein n=2 Tax=Neorhizobium TaxID=1525371 RepID=A0ABV0M2T5_9HYPH|nr:MULTISPECIES: hypothetical protein [Rhizobium/Agrobacterium group]KGD99526.1 hypothetical protein JL39_11875 [Rhizobium sp. YS-1r]MCC2609562.1 hypothetical protein [Neorhizobium petrolearium]WGI69765.1 hypothetical protein QEO92_06800 [Neorhizobium petrolearium]